jgi:hypothetical protein
MRRILLIISLLLAFYLNARSQDTTQAATKQDLAEVKDAIAGVNETILGMTPVLDALKKIKISGYVQTQFQLADSASISSYAGGNFPQNVKSRFQVRRGRFKINYDNDLTQYVLQLDVTQNGVGIKDAYASVTEPWLRMGTLTGGVFDRPFGFEISYSSSNREAPERSRMYQTLFPGERELGAKIEVFPQTGFLSNFNLKAGVFNGVLNTANENDRHKDFIGRTGFTLPFEDEGLAIDGGFSTYLGTVTANTKKIYDIDPSSSLKKYRVDSSTVNLGQGFDRNYYGFDMQVYYDIPVLGGATLRGEYIWGTQPGTDKASSFYNPDAAAATDTKSSVDGKKATDLYLRKFGGWYINFVQNIGLKNQFVVKYDVYDPNTDVAGNDLGAAGSNLNAGDIKYSTLGLGWVYHWDANVKFTFYYDWVRNEKAYARTSSSTFKPYTSELKDNVLTVRMQYKF